MSSVRNLAESEFCSIEQGSWSWCTSSKSKRRFKNTAWSAERRQSLEKTVQLAVIPQLFEAYDFALNRQLDPRTSSRGRDGKPPKRAVGELVRIVVEQSAHSALAYIAELRSQNVALEAIFLDLLTPAARRLGELWERDECDFATVTIATSRLQHILRELSPDFLSESPDAASAGEALIAALPGDQHTFGCSMLQEFFRRAGWHICEDIPRSFQDLIDIARSAPFKVIGISATCDAPTDKLARLIEHLRRATTDPQCRIVVGGRLFTQHPGLAEQVGADATANDGEEAARQFSSLLDTKPVRS